MLNDIDVPTVMLRLAARFARCLLWMRRDSFHRSGSALAKPHCRGQLPPSSSHPATLMTTVSRDISRAFHLLEALSPTYSRR